ncbi:MAG: sulfotransferase [Chloroflexia bacterium]|nr:sulfotransferase [Chloroflexia bacterium]
MAQKTEIPQRCPPLGLVRWRDLGRYLFRLLWPGMHYPLADQANSLSCQPLFIISSGRAGTTLLRSMLVASSQVAIPPEAHVFRLAIRRFQSLQGLGWKDLSRLVVALFESHHLFHLWETNLAPVYQQVEELPEKERSLARIIDEIFSRYIQERFPEALLWGDQSPINTLYLAWIYRTFPQGKYIHLLRDGRDVVSSMLGTKRTTLERATNRWIITVEQSLQLQQQIETSQFLEVRYEDLVTYPAETLQKICHLLGITYNEQMLEYWKQPTTLEHKHFDFHRNLDQPVFTSSIGKWKQRLTLEQQRYVLSKTSNLLERLQYPL